MDRRSDQGIVSGVEHCSVAERRRLCACLRDRIRHSMRSLGIHLRLDDENRMTQECRVRFWEDWD
jgi:hypothetical protein